MEAEDDTFVLVVVGDEEKDITFQRTIPSSDSLAFHNVIEMAKRHGQYIPIKEEPPEDSNSDILQDEDAAGIGNISADEELQTVIKVEPMTDYTESHDSIQDQIEDDYVPRFKRHTKKRIKKHQYFSFVKKLKEENPELRKDEKLLVNILEQIMRDVTHPLPPKDYFIMNGIMLECVYCGHMSDTMPAACRHYQETHGPRYLVCYACGGSYRSRTNLYKHEKRCTAPDARVVLKARAAFVGRKGRSRPYLHLAAAAPPPKKPPTVKRYPCQMCSAVFTERNHLKAHENLHKGKRPYLCHACPCAYTAYSALLRHIKKHSNAQFICDHCNRSFKIREALVAHLDTHAPIRKHGCEECGRRFAQKAALMLHINKIHRNLPPPFACGMCTKRYPRMSLLKTHMNKEHGMSIITRNMFLKSLPNMSDMELKQYDTKMLLESTVVVFS